MAAPELPRRLHSPSSEPFEGKHGSYAFFAPMLFGTFIWSGFKLVHHLVSLEPHQEQTSKAKLVFFVSHLSELDMFVAIGFELNLVTNIFQILATATVTSSKQ